MRVLLDSCIWGPAREPLVMAGHDVVTVGDWPEDPGDEEILRIANAQRRILITLDKDFGELAVKHHAPHVGIIRLVEVAGSRQAEVILHALSLHAGALAGGAIVTVEPGRLRVRQRDEESI